MDSKSPSYVIVTKDNVGQIEEDLLQKKGGILIVGPGFQSYKGHVTDICMSFYGKPYIQDGYIGTARGSKNICGKNWQTGWECDRSYIIQPHQKPADDTAWNAAREFFDRMPIGKGHTLKIGFEGCVAKTLFVEESTVIFVPNSTDRREAFSFALEIAWKLLGLELPDSERAAALDYVLNDLRDGKVFKHNVDAGTEADALVGL